MEILNGLFLGIHSATDLSNLWWCLAGVTLGTIVGVLPGIGPVAAISMLLPLTYSMPSPVASIIFLAGIYYGTQYGGSITSILLKIPGEAASVVTTIDGYAMTEKGRGGAAITISTLASFFAGCVATLLIALMASPLANLAIKFGPADYTSLMLLGIFCSVMLSNGCFLKNMSVALLGILLSLIGTDVNTGTQRFTLGSSYLFDGISFAIIAMGVFGLAEIVYNVLHEKNLKTKNKQHLDLYPTKDEIKNSIAPTLRGTVVGSVLGLIPGGGSLISSFASYALEKKISKNPNSFGHGNVAGVAAPEAANNAGAQTSFIPTLSLGLPINPIMSLMIAALMIQGIQPGPEVIEHNANLFWTLVVSMWIGNLILLILNVPLVSIWVQLLRINWILLYPAIIGFCILATYNINGSWIDIFLLFIFTIVGYVFRILKCEPAPLAMGYIVGSLFEENLRRSLLISNGNWSIFVESIPSLTFLVVLAIFSIVGILIKKKSV